MSSSARVLYPAPSGTPLTHSGTQYPSVMSLIKAVDDPYGKGKRAIVDALVEVWDLRKSEAEDCIRFARHVAIPSLDLEAFLRDELGWRSSEAINYVSANVHYLEQVPSLCEAKTPKELYEKLEDLNARRSLGRA
jgi:hypothetical protein